MNICVFFDFDGVIADSVESLEALYKSVLNHFDIMMDKNDFDDLNGKNLSEIVDYIVRKYELPGRADEVFAYYCSRLHELYSSVSLCEGAADILRYLKAAGYMTAIVSSSGRNEIAAACSRWDISGCFDFIVSGEDVHKAKPSPDIYQYAKEKVPQYRCLAVEDSLNGLIAAKNAKGIQTVYFSGNRAQNPEYAGSANFCINTFQKLKIVLKCLQNGVSSYHFIPGKIKVEVLPADESAGTPQDALAEQIWNQALMENEHLFNGKLLCYRSHQTTATQTVISADVCEYKNFYAQCQNIQSVEKLIYPIGVSGVIIDEYGNTAVGIRDRVTQYPGYAELVPSGNLDITAGGNAVDPLEQITTELSEECGIGAASIIKTEAFSLLYDERDRVFDIAVKILVKGSLHNYFSIDMVSSREYSEIRVVSLQEIWENLDGWLSGAGIRFVPVSYGILSNL